MGIHVLNKGKEGERQAVKFLQPMVTEVYESLGMEPPKIIRNQNQSAEGGYDLWGVDWIALEIKRQETPNKNAWWAQVNKAAAEHQVPVVMWRVNRGKWFFIVNSWMSTGGKGFIKVRCELNQDDFKAWFKQTLIYYAKRDSESTCV